MAKKRKSKSGGGGTANGKGGGTSATSAASKKASIKDTHQKQPPPPPNNYDSSSSSSSDDDSLVLEGTLIRNPDASDSSSDDDDGDISSEEETEVPMKKAKKSDGASKSNNNSNNTKKQQQQKKKKKQKQNEPETINVEFLFCDLHTKYFHGIKTLLHRNGVHVQHSSMLSDLIIDNEMVGTVLSTDDTDVASGDKKKAATATAVQSYPTQDENVFGFAAIINVSTNHTSQTIQQLKQICLKHCPNAHKSELTTVLSGQTARPAGFFFMERMVNVPLEITYILHEQLILDMDYAIQTADDEVERKSLDFGAFVRMAPCYKTNDSNNGGSGSSIVYKYFDDEIFATNSEFSYSFRVPKQFKSEEEDEEEDNMWCSVIVMTKTGHRCAMKELKKMIHG